ncbi:MAG: DoxX family protein [Bacteroidales bacterium]|jgi:putative oxidoreductase|nr:DoxX family protein [Bacteroidales bacterium]MDD3700198.1 DoxX family protein [Bacteroidales bacterium]MDY0370084.1 DoxX family protein [Bacteroidales bacterium]
MKKVFFSWQHHSNIVDIWLLINRMLLSAFMLTHGTPKFLKLLEGSPYRFSDPLSLGVGVSLTLAVVSEFVAPIFILFGLGARLASIPVIFTMITAAFVVHSSDPFATRELALLYLLGFSWILALGPGRYSVDKMIHKK